MRLTIAIATYNRNVMLKNLLMSISGLTKRHDIEVLVINDGGSEGKNIETFCSFLKKDGTNIRFIDRQENLNIFRTRLQLLKEATGDLLMFIDDDDFMDTITLHEWLNKIEYHLETESESYPQYISTVDAWIFDMIEFNHKQSGPGGSYLRRREYYATKTKLPFSLNSVIYNLNKLRVNLPLLEENVNKIEDHHKNIGEDIFCAYWLTGGTKNPNVVIEDGVLTLINYDMSNEHMAFTDRETNYVPGVGTMRMYTNKFHKTEHNG